ncbi:MAG: TonB-dependent receptor [Myxococcota bacterium]
MSPADSFFCFSSFCFSSGCSSFALFAASLIAFALTTVAPQDANAQQEIDPFAGVEEMIVTTDTTDGLLKPASTSAIAFDAADLDNKGVEDISDIAAYVPNLDIRSSNATNASFFVRGVGLQDFGSNASSSVPIFQDGIARNPSATQLVGLYDVGGLNVLRGPQGSGPYRNASGGAILISTAKPQPEFSGFAQVTLAQLVSQDSKDAARYNFEGATNVPIFEDWISARISARYSHESAFVKNGCANRVPLAGRPVARFANDAEAQLCDTLVDEGGSGNGESLLGPSGAGEGAISIVRPFLRKRIGEVDDWGFRGQIRIQPPDTNMDWIFRVEVSNLNRDSTVGQHIGTGGPDGGTLGIRDNATYRDPDIERRFNFLTQNRGYDQTRALLRIERDLRKRSLDTGPYRGDFDSPGRTILETHAASVTGSIEFDTFTLDTNIGFLDYRKSQDADTDLSPNRRFPSISNDQAWEIAGDLQLSGETVGELPLDWKAGVYTLLEQVEANQNQIFGGNTFPSVRANDFTQEIYSFGVYAEGLYEFLESFELSAGIRYQWERKDFDVKDANTLSGPFGRTFVNGSSNQRTWDAITGFGTIRYRFTEDIATYVKYARGFKAGHFNPSQPREAKTPGQGFADPEQIDEFEWGFEASAWDGRASINSALFYYNYRNYQVFRLSATGAGVFRIIQNADKARVYGLEATINLNPLEGYAPEAIERLSIKLDFGWLETEFLDYTEVDQRTFGVATANTLIDYNGQPLLNAANMQITGTFTWPLALTNIGTITPQYDFTWTDDQPFDANRGQGQIDGLGDTKFSPYLIGNLAYILHNVRLTYEPPGDSGLRVSGWCRNVTDERYSNFAVDISNFARMQLHFPADPRSCGADIRFSW